MLCCHIKFWMWAPFFSIPAEYMTQPTPNAMIHKRWFIVFSVSISKIYKVHFSPNYQTFVRFRGNVIADSWLSVLLLYHFTSVLQFPPFLEAQKTLKNIFSLLKPSRGANKIVLGSVIKAWHNTTPWISFITRRFKILLMQTFMRCLTCQLSFSFHFELLAGKSELISYLTHYCLYLHPGLLQKYIFVLVTCFAKWEKIVYNYSNIFSASL